jgi:hypothetical protein
MHHFPVQMMTKMATGFGVEIKLGPLQPAWLSICER